MFQVGVMVPPMIKAVVSNIQVPTELVLFGYLFSLLSINMNSAIAIGILQCHKFSKVEHD
jgi:hypothetical protein